MNVKPVAPQEVPEVLALTKNTIWVVNDLAQATQTEGLRIFAHDSGDELVFSAALVGGPHDGDEIVEQDGARVFVDKAVSDSLSDKRLDLQVSDGHVYLSVLAQS